MKQNVVTMILVFLCLGCTDDNAVITGPNADEGLKSKLLGSWNAGNRYRTEFQADNTYVDSIFYRSGVDTTQYLLDIVTQGRYTITNAILQKNNVRWYFADTTRYAGGLSIVLTSQEVQFSNDRLLLTPLDVLSSTSGFAFQLWGTWTLTTCAYHRTGGSPLVVYEGRQRYTYIFNKDSSYFWYGWEYLDGCPFPNPSFTSEYTYNPPLLDMLGPGWYNVNVQFKYGQMYWYFDLRPMELSRR